VQPAATQRPVADSMLTLVRSREDKITLCVQLLEQNTVVIVKSFLLVSNPGLNCHDSEWRFNPEINITDIPR
jgi:hypothetical protein